MSKIFNKGFTIAEKENSGYACGQYVSCSVEVSVDTEGNLFVFADGNGEICTIEKPLTEIVNELPFEIKRYLLNAILNDEEIRRFCPVKRD